MSFGRIQLPGNRLRDVGLGLIPAVLVCACLAFASIVEVPRAVELSVSGIFLHDSSGSRDTLRKGKRKSMAALTFFTFANKDRSEWATFVQRGGDETYAISEVRVTLGRPEDSVPVFPGAPTKFRSGRGIELGISKADLKGALGEPHAETDVEIRYRFSDSAWLQIQGAPSYESRYVFERGQLVRFAFGFAYP
jgi:hypothetical protein